MITSSLALIALPVNNTSLPTPSQNISQNKLSFAQTLLVQMAKSATFGSQKTDSLSPSSPRLGYGLGHSSLQFMPLSLGTIAPHPRQNQPLSNITTGNTGGNGGISAPKNRKKTKGKPFSP